MEQRPHDGAAATESRFRALLCLPVRRYVRLQQNGSGVVGIDSFVPLGSTTFYNDINQIITSWDIFLNIG